MYQDGKNHSSRTIFGIEKWHKRFLVNSFGYDFESHMEPYFQYLNDSSKRIQRPSLCGVAEVV